MAAKVKGFDRIENIFKNVPKDQRKQKLSEWGKKGNAASAATRAASRSANAFERRTQRWIEASVSMAISIFAEQVQSDIRLQFLSEIDRFYDDYRPVRTKTTRTKDGKTYTYTSDSFEVYHRTNSLQYAFDPVFALKDGVYTIGACLNPDKILGEPYHNLFDYNGERKGAPSDKILTFENFYLHGYHGQDIKNRAGEVFWTAPKMKHAPQEWMHYWWDSYKRKANRLFNTKLIEAMDKNKNLLKG